MITVYCENEDCQYNNADGTCGKRVIWLDESGQCEEDE